MVSYVSISQDDSEGVVLAKVMNLHIVIRSDCFGPGIGLVLVKVMKVAKKIGSDDKNARDRRPGWVPGGSVVCWRLIPFSGCRRGKEGGPPPGLAVLSVEARAAGRWSAGGGWAVVIRRQFGGI